MITSAILRSAKIGATFTHEPTGIKVRKRSDRKYRVAQGDHELDLTAAQVLQHIAEVAIDGKLDPERRLSVAQRNALAHDVVNVPNPETPEQAKQRRRRERRQARKAAQATDKAAVQRDLAHEKPRNEPETSVRLSLSEIEALLTSIHTDAIDRPDHSNFEFTYAVQAAHAELTVAYMKLAGKPWQR